ncbi:MAG: hypothetical protein M0T85_01910 [Dehalococcoidales bacterium]|nr:hypothetical protein [Dehalococcoidales bacterium]
MIDVSAERERERERQAINILKPCPRCGGEMEIEGKYLLCNSRSVCRYREPIPLHIKLERAGAQRLPGF